MWNYLYHPARNGLDNAVVTEVLSWKIKFSVNSPLSMSIECFMRISRISLKNWHRVKKRIVVLVSMLQEHNGFKVSSKLGLNVNKTTQIDSIYYKLYYKYRVFKILTRLCLGIPLNKNSYIDTSHLIFKSIYWFLHDTSFYWKGLPNGL